jgi:AraC-like DNA-binding protein
MHDNDAALELFAPSLSTQECSAEQAQSGVAPLEIAAQARGRAQGLVDTLGFVAPLCLAAPSAHEALKCAARLGELWSDAGFSVRGEGELVIVRMPVDVQNPAELAKALGMTQLWLELVERVRGISTYPQAVYFPAQSSEQRDALRASFSCVVHFDRPVAALMFSRADLEQANDAHDPHLFRLLSQFAEDKLVSLDAQRTMVERVHTALRALDDVSDASAEGVAHGLGLHVRTLHRKLQREGTSYRHVVAEFRMQRCEAQLGSHSSAKNIAYALGFANPASFHRAFKRWTGRTVGEYRQGKTRGFEPAARGAVS